MPRKGFPLLALALAGLAAAPARAQDAPAPERPDGFPRRYLDAAAYRTGGTLLHDWPALTRLVRWSATIEAAQVDPEATLSTELVAELRSRVDSLGAEPVPAFLEPVADSVATTIAEILDHLDAAEASLDSLPDLDPAAAGEPAAAPPAGAPPEREPPPVAEEERRQENRSDRQRTLVTGNTAVTVPAGLAVGAAADSLPTAALEATDNFFDRLALALTALDRLVHLTRTAGRPVSEDPADPPGASSAPGTPPPRAGP